MNHGLCAYRSGKCRCEVCTEAVRIDTNERRTARAAEEVPPHIKHGFASTYIGWRCRCEECMGAWKQDCARRRRNRMGTTPPKHGASGYSNYGCRCVECRAGKLEQERKRNAKKASQR